MARQANPSSMASLIEVDEIVEQILLREDRQVVLNKLFDEIHGTNVLAMIESRSDGGKIYRLLCADVLLRLGKQFKEQQGCEQSNGIEAVTDLLFAAANRTNQGGNLKEQGSTTGSVSCTPPKPHNISTSELPSTVNPDEKADTHPILGAYLTHSTTFDPWLSRLGIWVPTFITKEEICSIMPSVNELNVTVRRKKMVTDLLDFSKLLNPFYLCFYARKMFYLMKQGKISVYREPQKIEDTITSWNEIGSSADEHVLKALISYNCFQQCKAYMKKLTEEKNRSIAVRSFEESIEWSACTAFAQMEKKMNETSQSKKEPKHASISDTKKWLHILKLGEGISSMQEAFGGQ
ncbi:hypothetical protein F4809DRAFT_403396 [Biscogniauxia mediterranea]|nr:hypothetical protein F4809DRAFT_403396 [Biscogniauxia mediterranea]